MLLCIAIIIATVLIDQLTKQLVIRFIPLYDNIPLIKGVVSLEHIKNDGAAWGMLSNARWVFMLVSAVAIVLLLLYLFMGKPKIRFEGVALSLIIGGGIGNMIDRVLFGEVTDFIKTDFIDFPLFNGADSFVTVGCILMIVYLLFIELPAENKKEKLLKAAAETAGKTAETDTASGTEMENIDE